MDDEDRSVGGTGGTGGSPPSDSYPPDVSSDPTVTTTTTTTTTTKRPRPKGLMKDFVMCTVGVRFKEPSKYVDIPCDYLIFDNMVDSTTGIVPAQDFIAWQHFLEFVAMNPVMPMPGISLMGRFRFSTNWTIPVIKQSLTSFADKGIVAFGITGINISRKKTDLSANLDIVRRFRNSLLTDANSTIVRKGTFMTTFWMVEIDNKTNAQLPEFVQNLTDCLLVVRTHNGYSPSLFPTYCTTHRASLWSGVGSTFLNCLNGMKNITSPSISLGVSFTMGVQISTFKTTISVAAPPTGTCTYRAVTSYDDWCPLRSTEKYSATDMSVVNVFDQVLASYSTTTSMENLVKKFKETVNFPIGVMLCDIQFDMIDSTECAQDSSLSRVKSMAAFIRGQTQQPNP